MTSRNLTVLLPVLNGMPFLPEALESLAQQSDVELSVLAWDNGSVDGSVSVLKEWIPSRLPGEVVTDCPVSLAESLAAMVQRSETEFCARMDADDVCLPGRFGMQVEALLADEQLAVVGGQIETIDERGESHPLIVDHPLTDVDIVHQMLRVTGFAHPAVCFRRSAVLAVGNYRNTTEDYDLWLRLAAHHRLRNLPDNVLRYRFHEGSISQTGKIVHYRSDSVDKAFSKAGPPLYGCDEETLLALRQRRHPCAAVALLKISRHLSKRDGIRLATRLRMPSFREAAHRLVGPHDLVTRLALALFRPNPLLVYREARQVIQEFLAWQHQ